MEQASCVISCSKAVQEARYAYIWDRWGIMNHALVQEVGLYDHWYPFQTYDPISHKRFKTGDP